MNFSTLFRRGQTAAVNIKMPAWVPARSLNVQSGQNQCSLGTLAAQLTPLLTPEIKNTEPREN